MPNTIDLDEIVSEALEEANRDDYKAAGFLIKRARSDSELHKTIMWEGANQILRNHYSRRRKSAFRGESTSVTKKPKVSAAGGVDSEYDSSEQATRKRREEFASEFWSQYTLYGHKKSHILLRDASVRDLRISVQQHRSQIAGHKRSADFQERLANLMVKGGVKSNSVTVSKFFKLEQVVTISQEFEGGQ